MSSATRDLDQRELDSILQASRQRNADNAVTGLLLYCDGNFMQMLEGPPPSLDRTMARVRASHLHSGIIVLVDEPVSVREFGAWSMAFTRLQRPDFALLSQAEWVRSDDALSPGRSLLKEFWRNNSGERPTGGGR